MYTNVHMHITRKRQTLAFRSLFARITTDSLWNLGGIAMNFNTSLRMRRKLRADARRETPCCLELAARERDVRNGTPRLLLRLDATMYQPRARRSETPPGRKVSTALNLPARRASSLAPAIAAASDAPEPWPNEKLDYATLRFHTESTRLSSPPQGPRPPASRLLGNNGPMPNLPHARRDERPSIPSESRLPRR